MSFISRYVTKRNIVLPKLGIVLYKGLYNYTNFVCENAWEEIFLSFVSLNFVNSNASDNDPLIIEREKQRLLKGKVVGNVKHAPGWNERLASDSEAMIKAEREPDSSSMDDLQRETLSYLKTYNTHDMNETPDDNDFVETFKKKVEVKHHDKSSEVSEAHQWKMDIK
ncbi:11115_t:CDS:2 [Dentiscutata heterogama]|uniref:11115_t:CDS:1 n=1 Tax=Dentiscutata heterogama TaxID=1316150 RepID=A0ACA9MI71_9GLOM|nr:11115_t:CDS:2 [Dentiscutata heterogama]